jgi:hypothetical protein
MPSARFPGQGDGPNQPDDINVSPQTPDPVAPAPIQTTEPVEIFRPGREAFEAMRQWRTESTDALRTTRDLADTFARQAVESLTVAREVSQVTGATAHSMERQTDLIENLVDGTKRLDEAKRQSLESTDEEIERSERLARIDASRQEALDRVNEAHNRGAAAMEKQLRLAGFQERSGKFRIPGLLDPQGMTRRLSEDELKDILERGQQTQGQDAEYQALQAAMVNRAAIRGIPSEGPSPAFRFREAFGALARGDIGGALGETIQPFGFAERMRDFGGRRVEQGGAVNAIVGRTLPMLATMMRPAFLLAAEQAFSRGLEMFNSRADIGQAAGTGRFDAFREVAGGRFQAFRQGLNPFDALSRREASQIADTIRSEGFTGEVADAWQDAVGDVIIDTGMRVETALKAANVAAKELGLTASEFRRNMVAVDEVARESSRSVEEIVDSMAALQTAAGATGGVEALAAAREATEILEPVLSPEGMPPALFGGAELVQSPEQRALLGQMFGGLTYLETQGAAYFEALPKILDGIADRLMAQFPGFSSEEAATFIVTTGIGEQFIPGLPARAWQQLLNRAGKGRIQAGAAAQIPKVERRNAAKATSQIMDAADRARKDARGDSIWDKTPVTKGIAGLFGALDTSALDARLGPIDIDVPFFGSGDDDEMPKRERQAFTNSLARQLMKQGVPQEQRREILRPLWNARSRDEFKAGAERAENRVTELVIKLHPNARGIIDLAQDPTGAVRNQQYINGTNSSQGSRRLRLGSG